MGRSVPDEASRAIDHFRGNSRGKPMPGDLPVTLNFHPDAPIAARAGTTAAGTSMIEALARDGIYRSQFETGTSNGGLTAVPGGDRWRWESRIFGGAYDAGDPALRPKYGALNHLRRATGGSPRFGSAHLRLCPHVLARTTFCHPDSYHDPADFGTADRMRLIELAKTAPAADPLDRYVEAHVHGPLIVADDVEAVVLDPSHRGTEVEMAATRLGCAVEWHGGFSMPTGALPLCADYRGVNAVALAAKLARGGTLTPRQIGVARRAGGVDPQVLKRVWHCLACFGSPDPLPSGGP